MSTGTKLFIGVFALLGVLRLSGVIGYYNKYHEIDWWKLVIGLVFILVAIGRYVQAKNNPS